MANYFINITNHTLTEHQINAIPAHTRSCISITNHTLTEHQINAIPAHTEIVHLGFPQISAHLSGEEVEALACQWVDKLAKYAWPTENIGQVTVHIMGESVFVYAFLTEVRRLHGIRVVCVASTTERVSTETTDPDGTVKKTSEFKFIRFRSYY